MTHLLPLVAAPVLAATSLTQTGFIRSLILVTYGGLLCYLALRSLRAQRLKERYVLLFLFIGAPFLVLALWPDGIVFVHELLGIEKPTFMVLCLAAFLILIIFELLSIVSVQERKIASLAQMVGLLMERQHMGERQPGPTTPAGDEAADRASDAQRP